MKKEKESAYKFRQEPVPYCGRRHRYIDYFRQPKLGMVRRLNCEPGKYGYDCEDYFSVNKYKEQYLPWGWDDRERHLDRCWKTSFKVKKQWEKHAHKKRSC